MQRRSNIATGREEAMDGTSVRINFLPNRQRLIKDLTEMYKSMTCIEKVNRNLFKTVKAGSVL